MAVVQNQSELIFETYLQAHHYSWQYEPDLGVPGRPDYMISRGGSAAICEVKEFETDAIRELGAEAGGPVIVPPRLLYRTIRRQVRAAASKMRPLASRGIPIVVVLANPQHASVTLDPRTVFHAPTACPIPNGRHRRLVDYALRRGRCRPMRAGTGS
jgi:hypothetical protein